MSIPSAKYLKKKASNRLQSGNDPKKVVLVYAGIVALSSLVVTVVQDLLDSQISQTGGIQNIGTRSMLTTADTVLTIAQLLLVMCLTLGYTGTMLRIARGQYASPNSLKAGGDGLLGHIPPVFKIHLDHAAHMVQLGRPHKVFQVGLAERGILGHELHIVEVPRGPHGLHIGRQRAPKPAAHGAAALFQYLPDPVFSHGVFLPRPGALTGRSASASSGCWP